jgi:hypothetical protein
VAVEMMREDPAALLCTRPECEHCTAAREAIVRALRHRSPTT